ncbi:NBS-LRR type resistance protein [Cucumis melo var. makuwa]|uniref:NBS-LRR type resistance protein n=1 Tax=Cucumis melo var. makuwa TaxID=1194695 RepID=A0A5A7V1G1_CUCMM|nr:NBS-LRR type resistance protein [Cucumis melo var. makuwa]
MAFTHPSCPSPICPSSYPYLKMVPLNTHINQFSDPVRCTYQSSDLEGCTYQSNDPEGCTYQSRDPKGCTYQSSDPEGCTYQSSDSEGYTYQSRNPEGHRACKAKRQQIGNGGMTRSTKGRSDRRPSGYTRWRERTSEMEELTNSRMAGLEDSSVVDCSQAKDGNVRI